MKHWIILGGIFLTQAGFADSWTFDTMMQTKLIDAVALSSDGTKAAFLAEQYVKQNGQWHTLHELFFTDSKNPPQEMRITKIPNFLRMLNI
jgi:hypothetical protein